MDHHNQLSLHSHITHVCQLQGQSSIVGNLILLLPDSELKILSQNYIRIQYLYTEGLCWDKLQTQQVKGMELTLLSSKGQRRVF